LTTLQRRRRHDGCVAQVAALAGILGATLAMLGAIWALDKL
jgi:hypothetical protein